MKSLNNVQIIGRIGRDPEIKTLEKNIRVTSFGIATDESFKTKDGESVERTEWHNVTAFNSLADIICKYCKKGGLLYVQGKLKTRKYTDKNGVEKYATEIVAENILMLTSKSAKLAETDVSEPVPGAEPEEPCPY